MVYTAVIQRATRAGASIRLDHEYTSSVIPARHVNVLSINTVKPTKIPLLPSISRKILATKLQQNWQQTNPSDVKMFSTNLDDSLTSLGWLHNLNLMKSTVTSPTPPPSPTPDVEMDVNPNAILTVVNNVHPPYNRTTVLYQTNTAVLDKKDYRSNPYVKPPYSYATLICMAMKDTGQNKITLSSIYSWITENFMYYRLAEPSWQNSIRHNLSLNKCFQKVPRRKDEPGKGGFWRINPEYNDMLVDGVLKKRRTPTRETFMPVKRIKLEPVDNGYPTSQSEKKPTTVAQGDQSFVNEGVSQKDLRNGNYSWNQLLNQDIMVGGVTIKTEDIIDDHVRCLDEETTEAVLNITSESPPTSIENSDNSLDEIWNTEFDPTGQPNPLDLSLSGFALDLSIQGQGLRAPEWWDGNAQSVLEPTAENNPGMHTPVHTPDTPSHPWAEPKLSIEEAIDAFDMKNFFDSE